MNLISLVSKQTYSLIKFQKPQSQRAWRNFISGRNGFFFFFYCSSSIKVTSASISYSIKAILYRIIFLQCIFQDLLFCPAAVALFRFPPPNPPPESAVEAIGKERKGLRFLSNVIIWALTGATAAVGYTSYGIHSIYTSYGFENVVKFLNSHISFEWCFFFKLEIFDSYSY